jgi:hypothetical protein
MAFTVYWVSDCVDLCQVGFLPWQFIKQADKFDGKLMQITEFLAESDSPSCHCLSHHNHCMCHAAIITSGPESGKFLPAIKKLNREVHVASYNLDLLSLVPMADDIVGSLEGSLHSKKIQRKD